MVGSSRHRCFNSHVHDDWMTWETNPMTSESSVGNQTWLGSPRTQWRLTARKS